MEAATPYDHQYSHGTFVAPIPNMDEVRARPPPSIDHLEESSRVLLQAGCSRKVTLSLVLDDKATVMSKETKQGNTIDSKGYPNPVGEDRTDREDNESGIEDGTLREHVHNRTGSTVTTSPAEEERVPPRPKKSPADASDSEEDIAIVDGVAAAKLASGKSVRPRLILRFPIGLRSRTPQAEAMQLHGV